MNKWNWLLGAGLAFCGCIKPEAPNAEADITACSLGSELVKGDPVITNDKVVFLALPRIDRSRLAPQFELSPGATIEPPGGTVRDFSQPQSYRVRSEDGKWEKTYTVHVDTFDLAVRYSFERYELKGNYHVFYELSGDARQDVWASANAGYTLTGMGSEPERFPTVSIPDGRSGRGVLLQTRSTGIFGTLFSNPPKPLAAGNFFIGTFDASKVMSNHLQATRFGFPFGQKPLSVTGFYKYTAGPVFTNRQSEEVPGHRDEGHIYAVLFETSDTVQFLDGTNIALPESGEQHPAIVARAEISGVAETEEWRFFEIPFVYYRETEAEKWQGFKYSLAIVFTSSKWGDLFEGAVGSKLYIDEIAVVCE